MNIFNKQGLVVVFFVVGMLTVVALSQTGDWEKKLGDDGAQDQQDTQNLSVFSDVVYLTVNSSKPTLSLKSTYLTIDEVSKDVNVDNPKGYYLTDGEKVNYQGRFGYLDQKDSFFQLSDDVKVSSGNTNLTADKVDFEMNTNLFKATGHVFSSTEVEKTNDKIIVKSNQLEGRLNSEVLEYSGNVNGEVQRKRRFEPSTYFWANTVAYIAPEARIDLNGNVRLKRGQMSAKSRRGEILLENYSKQLKYFSLYDDVQVVEKVTANGKSFERKSYSEKLEGLAKDRLVILTGFPRVYQLEDTIQGNKIILREDSEMVEVDDANTNFVIQ